MFGEIQEFGSVEFYTEICIKSLAHELMAALALFSEGSLVINLFLREHKLNLKTFIEYHKHISHQVRIISSSNPRQL